MSVEETKVDDTFIRSMEEYRRPNKEYGLIQACSENVVVFTEYMLGIKLYSWQVSFLNEIQEAMLDPDGTREFAAITSRQIGKAQPLYSKVLTPTGWTTMGDIQPGDFIIGSDGNQAEVQSVHPQGKIDNYRITFTDGTSTECSGEHLWTVKSSGCKNWKVETLNKIIKDRGMNPSSDNAYRIPLTDPVKFKERKHIISPYLMGVLLGDGSFRNSQISITSNDKEIIKKCLDDNNIKYRVNNKKVTTAKQYTIQDNNIKDEIIRLGLYKKNSSNKFIPQEYLFDSINNRTELLRGLMDTDGSVYGNCVMEYSSISKELVEGIKFIIESLGGNIRVKERESFSVFKGIRKKCKNSYRVFVRLQNINPFYLPRKADKWYNIKYKRHRIIDKIERLSDTECKCITVDNTSHTYLTDNFIVTHNSTALSVFCLWACIFNKYKGTTANNTSCLIVSASDVQAKKLLYEMKRIMRIGEGHMRDKYKDEEGKPLFGEEFFENLLDDHEPNNTTTITFKPYKEDVHGEYLLKGSKSGSTIKSYPPTSSVLGETASIVIEDEAGKSDKITDQFHYDYLYPTGNSTDAVRIYTSTPWQSSGFFYRIVDPDNMYGDSGAYVCLFTIEAINKENPKQYKTVRKIVDQLNSDGKKDEVQRAYYCRFVKGESAYFDPEKVFNVFEGNYTPVDKYIGKCDIGVDFGGQRVSKTVITISELTEDNVIRRLYKKVYEVGEDDGLIDDIANLKKDFNIQRIIVDDCPAGQYLIRKMKDKGWDIQPMNFRQEKVKKYGAFRSALNRGRVKSFDDETLRTEMLALEFGQGAQSSVIKHAPGYSDDEIDSFLMSTYFFIEDEDAVTFFDWRDI